MSSSLPGTSEETVRRMADSSRPIGSAAIHRRYTDPAYSPRPGSRLRAVADTGSRTSAPLLLGLSVGTFISSPLERTGWIGNHSLAVFGILVALSTIGFAITTVKERRKDDEHRWMNRSLPASLIIPADLPWGLGLTELQVSRAVELKWELDALDRSQKDGISDGYPEERESIRDQMRIVLTSGSVNYPDPRKG